ncbi:UNVERIFIED_CONTAM: hypothetical protein FKN15_039768 [Acipenser sinensis]
MKNGHSSGESDYRNSPGLSDKASLSRAGVKLQEKPRSVRPFQSGESDYRNSPGLSDKASLSRVESQTTGIAQSGESDYRNSPAWEREVLPAWVPESAERVLESETEQWSGWNPYP